ncbi:formate dehydrogenase subunit delta [Actinophytocola oryzae]|uniref:Formate dehydrogenase delta subunit n=1 Tax=Actinophytocola oryzae TaxID=502181 RepID=A0A4R7VV39_9PSEU|nr:formate dehydrogenase subunit delta [Actinophytocola oryzae]TDV53734.1 formate dehydrogenase delta subunit [Actinophytocola oryzae]
MSDGLPPHVRLANEISIQFAHLDPADGAARVARHMHDFWEPRMLRALLDYKDAGGEDLDPLAAVAIEQLRQPA